MAGASRRTSQAGDQLGQADQPDPHQQTVFGILSGLLLAWPTSTSRCCGRQPRRRCSSSTTRRSGNWASASSGSLRSCRRSWRTCYCTPSVTTFMSWPPRSPSSTTTATALRRTGRVVSVGLGLLHVPVTFHGTGNLQGVSLCWENCCHTTAAAERVWSMWEDEGGWHGLTCL